MNDYIKSIYFKEYKSFSGDEFQELKDIKKVNVIIGKNNTGKSSIIDILDYSLVYEDFKNNLSRFDQIKLGSKINEAFMERYELLRNDRTHYFAGLIGKEIVLSIKHSQRGLAFFEYSLVEQQTDYGTINNIPGQLRGNHYIDFYKEYLYKMTLRRLNADRDINPETEDVLEELHENGNGASNLIRTFILGNIHDEKLIEEKLLDELNDIMKPEAEYENIKIQLLEKNEPNRYEVFLSEKKTGRFALSQSGSGLKTIILILLNLWIVPEIDTYKNKKIVYAFEEIENNLHPALQRRLFDYLYKYAIEHNTCIFLTTHSHVAINTFFGKDEAQIYHVIKENNVSSVKQIDNYIDKVEILNDLDVRASDLFQSNGIIWVEGPTDRIYIKQWLEVFCENEFAEGKDYQFLYYGGRLLSHYDATEDEGIEKETEDLINILTTNRNSAIVMDSDKANRRAPINDTKKRVRDDFKSNGQFCWITKGREIENYLAKEVLEDCFGVTIRDECEQYGKYSEYIKDKKKGISKTLQNEKVRFARKVYLSITKDNSKDILDLQEQISKLYREIKKWNGQA